MRSVSRVVVVALVLLVQLLSVSVVHSANYSPPTAAQIAALNKYQNIIILVESAASFDFLLGQPAAPHITAQTHTIHVLPRHKQLLLLVSALMSVMWTRALLVLDQVITLVLPLYPYKLAVVASRIPAYRRTALVC